MIKLLLILLVRVYRYAISPFLAPRCRFFPSCSEYSMTALKQYNIVTGLFLTLKRVVSCHPFGEHGYDPVPVNFSLKSMIFNSLKRFTNKVLYAKR